MLRARLAAALSLSAMWGIVSLAPVDSRPSASPQQPSVTLTIHMRDSSFSPETASVKVGDTVGFFNDDEVPHNVTGNEFKSNNIAGGKSWQYTVTKAGTYVFVCTYHPWMKGTIVAAART